MTDQDPFAATAIKPTAKKRQKAAPAGDPFAATAIQSSAAAPAATAPRYAPPPSSNLPSQEGFLASAAAPFVGAAKGLKSAFYEGPQNPQEAGIEGAFKGSLGNASWIPGRAVLAAKRMFVDPQVEQGKQAISDFSQSAPTSLHPTQDQLGHRQLALGHGLAAALPAIGPWAASVAEKGGEQLGTGNYSGAAGTAVGNAALALAPKAFGKVKETVPGTIRRLAGSGPGVARDLVRTAAEDNRKIALHNTDRLADAHQAWREKQAKALYDHKAELLRLQQKYTLEDLPGAQAKAVSENAADRAKYQSEQQASKAKYDEEIRKATEEFTKARTEAQRTNDYTDNMLDLRRKGEQALQQATDDYYAKNAAADVRARGEENSAWSALWQKLKGKTVDGSQIAKPLERIAAISPETAQFLRRLQVDPEDAPRDSLYAQNRAAIMQAQGYRAPYESFPKHMRDEFDRTAVGSGFEPEPIDLNPQPGQSIPVEQIHRASSILQGYIRDGRFDSNMPLRGEMKQLAKTLRASIDRVAAEAKAGTDLNAARNSTIVRQGAFGKEPYSQKTTRTAQEQRVNPAADAQRAEEAGLDRTRRYDPTLVDAYRRVKAARQALEKLPNEEQLRGERQQVPLRADLPLRRLQPPAPEPRSTELPLPLADRAAGPDLAQGPYAPNLPLPPVIPEMEPVPFREPKLTPSRTISADDIQRANEAGVLRRGSGVTSRLIGLSVVWPAFRMLSELTRGRTVSPGGLVTIPAAGAAGMAIEELLAHPAVKEFLTRPTRQQIAQIPPGLRGDIPDVVSAAQSRGVHISPLLVSYAAAIQRNRAGQQANTPGGAQPSDPSTAQGEPQ